MWFNFSATTALCKLVGLLSTSQTVEGINLPVTHVRDGISDGLLGCGGVQACLDGSMCNNAWARIRKEVVCMIMLS